MLSKYLLLKLFSAGVSWIAWTARHDGHQERYSAQTLMYSTFQCGPQYNIEVSQMKRLDSDLAR